MRPLIQSHLFVLIPHGDMAWSIEEARGVRHLFRYLETDAPKRVRWTEMRRLQAAVAAGQFDTGFPFKARDGDIPGDLVQTPHGFVGELLTLDERGRAELLTEIMGEKRIVRGVDAHTLQRVIA